MPLPSFGPPVKKAVVGLTGGKSGLAHSRAQTNVCWTHKDTADAAGAKLYGFSPVTGTAVTGSPFSIGATSYAGDWEDIAIGPDGKIYIWDNYPGGTGGRIIRVNEPIIGASYTPNPEVFLLPSYTKGVESLMVDNNGDVYIVQKYAADNPGGLPVQRRDVVKFTAAQFVAGGATLTVSATIQLTLAEVGDPQPTWADCAATGLWFCIGGHAGTWTWIKTSAETVETVLTTRPGTRLFLGKVAGGDTVDKIGEGGCINASSTGIMYLGGEGQGTSGSGMDVDLWERLRTDTVGPLAGARGVYMLGKDTRNGNAALEYVTAGNASDAMSGWAIRTNWKDYQTGASTFDWSILDTGLTTALAQGKKLSIKIDAVEVPAFVLSAAVQKYDAIVPLVGSGVLITPTPVPWDRPSVNSWKAFLTAMADHTISGTAVKNHAALGPLRLNVVGRKTILRDLSYTDPNSGQNKVDRIDRIACYTRAKWVGTAVEQINHALTTFPGIPVHFGCFNTTDGNNTPDVDTAMLNALGALGSVNLGVFNEQLTAVRPKPGPLVDNLQYARGKGMYVAFQALAAWFGQQNGGSHNWTPADGNDPGDGISYGHSTFGALYFEIYKDDIEHFSGICRQWNTFLATA